MATADLGKVVGIDGFNPVVQIVEDTLTSYRLSIQDRTHTIVTPNLRGIQAKYFTIEINGRGSVDIPLGELGLSPDYDYAFYASAGLDYPLLRGVVAYRRINSLRVAVYYDTNPYTTPQSGSPFLGGIIKIGSVGLKVGEFKTAEEMVPDSFPVNILCFEIVDDKRRFVKIGTPGLKVGNFQVGQIIVS